MLINRQHRRRKVEAHDLRQDFRAFGLPAADERFGRLGKAGNVHEHGRGGELAGKITGFVLRLDKTRD